MPLVRNSHRVVRAGMEVNTIDPACRYMVVAESFRGEGLTAVDAEMEVMGFEMTTSRGQHRMVSVMFIAHISIEIATA
jgi:hypothetical protein